jgi:hypothetical protein
MKSVPGQPFDFVALMGGRNVFHKTEIYADLFAPQRRSDSEIDRHIRKETASPFTTGRRSYLLLSRLGGPTGIDAISRVSAACERTSALANT